jgi:hypothetical protein
VGATERDEFLRATWRALVAGHIDAQRLVFVDEMGSNTALFSLYVWARLGERVRYLLDAAQPQQEYDVAHEHDARRVWSRVLRW